MSDNGITKAELHKTMRRVFRGAFESGVTWGLLQRIEGKSVAEIQAAIQAEIRKHVADD